MCHVGMHKGGGGLHEPFEGGSKDWLGRDAEERG